jgi:ATP-dependent RNA helicase DbpA
MQNTSDFLKNLGITELNEMQKAVLNKFQKGADLILYSPTGSGKTVAFLFSILSNLQDEPGKTQVIIIAPVRELAIQIDTVFRKMATGFRVACVYGGHSVREEQRSLEVTPAILIGTPGRILDLMHRRILDGREVHTLVLDEFDKSLELGFEKEMSEIAQRLHAVKTKILTSATRLHDYPRFLKLDSPTIVDQLSAADDLKIEYFSVKSEETEKMETAFRLACEFGNVPVIFFCNHRETVERLSGYFDSHKLAAAVFHGGMEQDDREKELIKFRNGSRTVLVSTDLAARGLDIENVEHVVHFQMPLDDKSMTHRNGRTARAGKTGNVWFILAGRDHLPGYFGEPVTPKTIPAKTQTPVSKTETLFFNLGKKDKINKIDLVGFLCQAGGLDKSEIGLISVLDHRSYVAVKREKVPAVLRALQGQKIKKKSARFGIAE